MQETAASWPWGVLAKNGEVTPSRSDEIAKHKLTLRDAVLVFIGCAGMYGAQIARDAGMRSDVRDLKTSFDAYKESEDREIAHWRQQTNLNTVDIKQDEKDISELKGMMLGAGIKGAANVGVKP